MKLWTGFKLFWIRAFDYKGKSSRREFWWGVFANSIIMLALIALLIVSLTCLQEVINPFSIVMIILFSLFCIVEFIPSITLIIRRMHDIGKSGFYVWILCIPIFGLIWYFTLVTRPSVKN